MTGAPSVWRSWPPEMLDALLRSVADPIYVVDPDGRVLFANPAALETLGYDDAGELLGRQSHAAIHSTYPDGTPFPEEDCPLLRPRTSGETVRVEEDWFVRRDGSMVPVAYSSAPLATAHGRGAVVVFRDITELLRAQEAQVREAAERTRAEELRASRERIVAAADKERRRIGRDLHDGAQQRLVHVLMTLRSASARLGTDDDAARAAIDDAAAEIQDAVAELRDLVAGIHPAILTSRGSPPPSRASPPARRCPSRCPSRTSAGRRRSRRPPTTSSPRR